MQATSFFSPATWLSRSRLLARRHAGQTPPNTTAHKAFTSQKDHLQKAVDKALDDIRIRLNTADWSAPQEGALAAGVTRRVLEKLPELVQDLIPLAQALHPLAPEQFIAQPFSQNASRTKLPSETPQTVMDRLLALTQHMASYQTGYPEELGDALPALKALTEDLKPSIH